MDMLQTCQTVVIILDNLISLIVFIITVVHHYYSPPTIVRLDKFFKVMQKKIRVVRKSTKRILLPEYSLMFQYLWTRDKLGDLVDYIKSDKDDKGTKSNIIGNDNQRCGGEFKNSTISGMFEAIKHSTILEDDVEETTQDPFLDMTVRFALLLAFGVIAFFSK